MNKEIIKAMRAAGQRTTPLLNELLKIPKKGCEILDPESFHNEDGDISFGLLAVHTGVLYPSILRIASRLRKEFPDQARDETDVIVVYLVQRVVNGKKPKKLLKKIGCF